MRTLIPAAALFFIAAITTASAQGVVEDLRTDVDELKVRVEALEAAPDPGPVPTPPPTDTPPTDTPPDDTPDNPPTGDAIAIIAAMPVNSWARVCEPFDKINADRSRNFDGHKFANVLSAWNGAFIDAQGDIHIVASGGHNDGTDNSYYRHHLDTCVLEIVIDHVPPNHRGTGGAPDEVRDAAGNILRPHSTHTYAGGYIVGDYLYFSEGAGMYPQGNNSRLNWRIDLRNPAYERLADSTGTDRNKFAMLADGTMVSGKDHNLCERDILTGVMSNCTNEFYFTGVTGTIYGGESLWMTTKTKFRKIDKVKGLGKFTLFKEVDHPEGWNGGTAIGACVVPSAFGDVPIFMGNDRRLVAWTPAGELVIIDEPNAPNPASKIYTKWGYVASLGVCIGVARTSEKIFVYKPDMGALLADAPVEIPDDDGETTPPPADDVPDPTPPVPNDGTATLPVLNEREIYFADFNGGPVRLAGEPVTKCAVPMDLTCKYRDWQWGTKVSSKTTGPHVRDGFLEFIYPDLSGSGRSGYFRANLIEGGLDPFGPGDKLKWGFDFWANCDAMYLDCDPDSEDYLKERRSFFHTSGKKTGFKTSIMSVADDPDSHRPADSCERPHFVTVHGSDHTTHFYHNCAFYDGASEPTNSQTYPDPLVPNPPNYAWDSQPNGEFGGCPNRFDKYDETGNLILNSKGFPREFKKTWGNIHPGCAQLQAEVWQRIEVEISMGEWQPRGSKDGFEPKSLVKMWLDGKLVLSHLFYNIGLFDANGNFGYGKGYGHIELLPYMTKKDDTERHPTAIFRYDNLLVEGCYDCYEQPTS